MAGLLDFLGLGGLLGGSDPAQKAGPLSTLGTQPQPSGGLTGVTPMQQKWMDAIGGFAAALKDAGAYLQHQPEAAGNVANFNAQRQQRLQDEIGPLNYNNLLLQMIAKPAPAAGPVFPNGLPPGVAAWLLLQQLQQGKGAPVSGQIQAPEQAGNPAPAA